MGTPTDWGSGERVFGPPGGTLDVDWLVPALLERRAVTPDAARRALERAWAAYRGGAEVGGAETGRAETGDAEPRGADRESPDSLAGAAEVLVQDAARAYGVPRGGNPG